MPAVTSWTPPTSTMVLMETFTAVAVTPPGSILISLICSQFRLRMKLIVQGLATVHEPSRWAGLKRQPSRLTMALAAPAAMELCSQRKSSKPTIPASTCSVPPAPIVTTSWTPLHSAAALTETSIAM